MKFEGAVQLWLDKHIGESRGERKRRLGKGLGHASMLFLKLIWWPAFGNFDDLYPEFEVRDFKDGVRFIDFAYIRPWFRIAIEIDGFGPHERDVNREHFADERDRQTDLCIDGWEIMRFSYDRVKERPRTCESRVRLMLERCRGEARWAEEFSLEELEIIRLARRNPLGIKRLDVMRRLRTGERTAGKLLHGLVEKNVLVSLGNNRVRVHRYGLAHDRLGKTLM